jgi:putative aminopeptidase FrvX
MEVMPSGTGTDANAIQVTQAGVPTALLSIPLRNMHTPIETLAVKDVLRTGRLLAYTIAGLDEGFFNKLTGQVKGAGA